MTLLPLILLGVAVICAVVLASRGRGKGGGAAPVASISPVPALPRTEPLRFGYFCLDGNQLEETADHVSYVMLPDWGTWALPDYDAFRSSTMVTQLQEAKARGVKEAWIMVGWLVFTAQPGSCYAGSCFRVRPDAMTRVATFRAQLATAGVVDMVKVLYPADEPELYGLDDASLLPLLAQIKAAWPGPKLAVIYGGDGHGYPGLQGFDLVGKDKYDVGTRILEELPPIRAGQSWLVVPGGADPWRQDPAPFVEFAKQHGNVYAVVAFTWFDNYGGTTHKGIRSNGMADAYRAAGRAVVGG